jgi:hypothetical protein
MLYANENIKIWNPETGEMSGKSEVIDAEVERVIDEGLALAQLKQARGWILLEGLLKDTCADLKEKLTYEQDLDKFRRLQEAVKAYQNVMNFVDYKIAEGLALQEQKTQSPEEG